MPDVLVLLPVPPTRGSAGFGLSARLPGLRGRRIGVVNNGWWSMDVLADEMRGLLLGPDGAAEVIEVETSGAQRLPDAACDDLAGKVDAAIVGLGNCGSCSRWILHDAIELERRGIPTVTLFTKAFAALASTLARSEGVPDIPTVTLPHPINPLPENEVRAITRDHHDAMIGALVAR